MTDSSHHSRRERFEEFEKAAIEAELDTGRREESIAEAKRHILIRIGRVFLGTIVVIAGLLMLPLPGPGMLTIAAGLALLASDVPFARNLLESVRKRLPADADGKVSKPVVIGGLVVSVVTVASSLWWTFFR
ncbi:MAG: PGPGW domain-containing protein [Actinomycetia bacterium]|nr:PGPGW domain-containing protein [Actinomycetes bacterium]